jgi:mannose-6-phosphate isomerase-like protein (cupin superfamily)
MLDPTAATRVGWDDLPDGAKVARPDGYVHPWATDAPYAARVFDEAIGVRHLSFVMDRMPPGSSGQHHRHVEAEEVHVVMRGRCEMRIDDELVTLEEHDAVRVPARAYRSMHNPGPEECWMLVVGAPLDEFTEAALDQFIAVNDWSGARPA